jgi:hypothetical protein
MGDQERGDDDPPFIVLTETKFIFRCIPVWDRYSPHRTRVEKKKSFMRHCAFVVRAEGDEDSILSIQRNQNAGGAARKLRHRA